MNKQRGYTDWPMVWVITLIVLTVVGLLSTAYFSTTAHQELGQFCADHGYTDMVDLGSAEYCTKSVNGTDIIVNVKDLQEIENESN